MKIWNIVLFSLLAFSLSVLAHPHHHSIAIFDYNAQDKQLELSLKILTEDFLKINSDQKASYYLQKHLKIEVNSSILSAQHMGSEEDHEFMWFYYIFKVEISKGNNVIEVKDTILKSINKNQFNTVKVTLFEQKQVHNYLFSEDQYIFVFD